MHGFVATGDEQDAEKVVGSSRPFELICATVVNIDTSFTFSIWTQKVSIGLQPLDTESRLPRTPTAALANPHPYGSRSLRLVAPCTSRAYRKGRTINFRTDRQCFICMHVPRAGQLNSTCQVSLVILRCRASVSQPSLVIWAGSLLSHHSSRAVLEKQRV